MVKHDKKHGGSVSLSPSGFPNNGVNTTTTPELLDVLGPRAGPSNELRLSTEVTARPLAIGGARKKTKKTKKTMKTKKNKLRKSLHNKKPTKKTKKSRNNKNMHAKINKSCKECYLAACPRRKRHCMKGGNNILDSASFGLDTGLNTLKGALANPMPALRSNSCKAV